MFVMPTGRRILLCRSGFVLLCVLPTLAVGLWALARSPGIGLSREAWERELAGRLGLVVEIGAVSDPQPDEALLEDVQFRDPETLALVAQARTISLRRAASGWSVAAAQVQIETAQLPLLRQTLEHRVLRAPWARDDVSPPPLTIALRDVTLASSHGSQSLSQLHGTLLHEASGVSLRLEWQLAASSAAAGPGQFTILRNRAAQPPETVWQLDTAGQAAPAMLLADLLPQVARLGRECKFTGSVQGSDSPGGARGAVRGTLSGVDLDGLVTEHFPHQLSGLARVEIARAEVDDGKLTALSGSLTSQDGAISLSLLEALHEHLQLELLVDSQTLDAGRPVAFERLAASFDLDGRRLAIAGQAGLPHEGIVLADEEGPLLAAPRQHAIAPVSLLRALVPDNRFQVPATRQTDALVGILPLPDIVPARTATLPRHTPTRLRESGHPEAAPVLRQPQLR